MTLDEILSDAKVRMDAAVEKVRQNFAKIRTGRANPQILSDLTVDYYGNPTPLQQLANFSVPEPRILIVNPFDKGSVGDIERAIRDSDFGFNPSSDGNIIRCVFPELTEERRKEYIKVAKEDAEEGKISIRNIRRDARDEMQELADEGEVGEDVEHRYEKKLDEATSSHVSQIDKLLEAKEEDLLEV